MVPILFFQVSMLVFQYFIHMLMLHHANLDIHQEIRMDLDCVMEKILRDCGHIYEDFAE